MYYATPIPYSQIFEQMLCHADSISSIAQQSSFNLAFSSFKFDKVFRQNNRNIASLLLSDKSSFTVFCGLQVVPATASCLS